MLIGNCVASFCPFGDNCRAHEGLPSCTGRVLDYLYLSYMTRCAVALNYSYIIILTPSH